MDDSSTNVLPQVNLVKDFDFYCVFCVFLGAKYRMKFKFLVDGVWRIDERQPISEDEYGVNNVVLVEQPQLMPQTLLFDDGLPVMDIDSYDDRNHADVVSIYKNIKIFSYSFYNEF